MLLLQVFVLLRLCGHVWLPGSNKGAKQENGRDPGIWWLGVQVDLEAFFASMWPDAIFFLREAMEFYKLQDELESSDESGEDDEDTTEDESDDWKETIIT